MQLTPSEFHNLTSATSGAWVVYSWTNGKVYRPGEPIALSLRFLTESDSDFESPRAKVILTDATGKMAATKEIELKTERHPDKTVQIYKWKTPNLFPDESDPKISALVGQGKYVLKVQVTFNGEEKVELDKLAIEVANR